MNLVVRKPFSGFPTTSDTNQAVQPQKMARSLKFWIKIEEELHYPCGEKKGPDQLRSYREADLRLCFAYAKSRFSHNAAQMSCIMRICENKDQDQLH